MATVKDRRKYPCSQCNKIYTKAEHLTRHERTHSGSKPFTCSICRSTFARQDSLARHAKRHTYEQNPDLGTQATPAVLPGSSNVPESQADSFQTFGSIPQNIGEPEISALLEVPEDVSGAEYAFADQFMQLSWPDSENLLQSILSVDRGPIPPPLEVFPSQSILRTRSKSVETSESPWLDSTRGDNEGHGGTNAVRNLSQIITTVSADVAAEAESIGLTTVFLDGCLHMFFTHFVPSFPVVHRPTFVFRDWTHPLLLNAIALGSRFVAQKENDEKGERLWRLAHTAVATSWHTLIKHRGPYDSCSGVQLVLTALLGQVYAIFSKNVTLRMTAQIFHSLGFFWARECGMYEVEEEETDWLATCTPTDPIVVEKWREWAARETKLRALLGHYILDGQISQYTGGPTCQRHTSNTMQLPSDNTVFEAATPEEWIVKMRETSQQSTTFGELFNALFSVSIHVHYLSTSLSSLTINVVLEGLKSLVSETNDAVCSVVGLPTRQEISRALGRVHQCILSSQQLSSLDRSQALLRWHGICLDAASDSGLLCGQICSEFKIKQNVFGVKRNQKNRIKFKDWSKTPGAKRALLHAVAIWEILQNLPFGRAHAIHIPASVFAAAIIYTGFCLAGAAVVSVPTVCDWERIMSIDLDSMDGHQSNHKQGPDQDIRQYLFHQYDSSRTTTPKRSLLYDLNLLPIYLKGLSKPWGVAANMEEILEQMITVCSN